MFYGLALLLLLLVGYIFFLYHSADMMEPAIEELYHPERETVGNYSRAGNSELKKNKAGVWELRVRGEAYRRGCEQGVLMKELLQYQEEVFVERLNFFVPSKSYQKVLRFFMQVFNRKLGHYTPEEYRREIYGISQYCSDDYNDFGTPYQRQLNYHAAHDIGHTMQGYMLVGCTSFATWGDESVDSMLLVGRNFDFYINDDFARNKLISIVEPDQGYAFVSVAWPGMIGVLSGMNEAGLCVTINAAQGGLPGSAKTPISILARQIVQYASTIEEAYAIADTTSLFVSETLLVASAKDGRAAIIEKTPDAGALFQEDKNFLVCSNHFQSDIFADDAINRDNILYSDSKYRFDRTVELIGEKSPLQVEDCIEILRNKNGLGGEALGYGNPMAINQLLAHHSVVFNPFKRQMWVSSSPWQEGRFLAYDLNTIFEQPFTEDLFVDSLSYSADSLFLEYILPSFRRFKAMQVRMKEAIGDSDCNLDDAELMEWVNSNPNYYYVYMLLGDYHMERAQVDLAIAAWKKALQHAIPTHKERQSIVNKINEAGGDTSAPKEAS